MKFTLFLTIFLMSMNVFASSMSCHVKNGHFVNDSLEVKSLKLESTSDDFNMLSAKKMLIKVFEEEEVFTVVARTTTGNRSKIDYVLDSDPEKVKAVLLLDRAYGRVTRKMNGLLLITGTNFNFSGKSLVYNISCKI